MKLFKSPVPARRVVRRPAVILAALALCLSACSAPELGDSAAPSRKNVPPLAHRTYVATAQVLDAVKAARDLQTLPAAAAAALAKKDAAGPQLGFDCHPKPPVPSTRFGECAYGDPHGTKLMVIYGDSHATMWAATLEGVAAKHGWKLRVFSLGGCPAPDLHFAHYDTRTPNEDCDKFREGATKAIQDLHPDLVIATSMGAGTVPLAGGSWPSGQQWRDAWISMFHKLTQPGTRMAMLGDLPSWKNNDASCLAGHLNEVQKCSAAVADATYPLGDEQAAALGVGAFYVSPQPWICSDQCEPVIADKVVYEQQDHLTQTYAVYLTGALGEALRPVLDQA